MAPSLIALIAAVISGCRQPTELLLEQTGWMVKKDIGYEFEVRFQNSSTKDRWIILQTRFSSPLSENMTPYAIEFFNLGNGISVVGYARPPKAGAFHAYRVPALGSLIAQARVHARWGESPSKAEVWVAEAIQFVDGKDIEKALPATGEYGGEWNGRCLPRVINTSGGVDLLFFTLNAKEEEEFHVVCKVMKKCEFRVSPPD